MNIFKSNQKLIIKRGEEAEEKGLVKFEMNRSADGAYHAYQHMLNYDIARELARTVLPVSNYTECIWKIDLHNFFSHGSFKI